MHFRSLKRRFAQEIIQIKAIDDFNKTYGSENEQFLAQNIINAKKLLKEYI